MPKVVWFDFAHCYYHILFKMFKNYECVYIYIGQHLCGISVAGTESTVNCCLQQVHQFLTWDSPAIVTIPKASPFFMAQAPSCLERCLA